MISKSRIQVESGMSLGSRRQNPRSEIPELRSGKPFLENPSRLVCSPNGRIISELQGGICWWLVDNDTTTSSLLDMVEEGEALSSLGLSREVCYYCTFWMPKGLASFSRSLRA